MKHRYRGELNSGKVVNIFDFDGRIAKCDNGFGDIDIDEFNTIFYPKNLFEKEVLGITDIVEATEEVVEVSEKKTKKSDS